MTSSKEWLVPNAGTKKALPTFRNIVLLSLRRYKRETPIGERDSTDPSGRRLTGLIRKVKTSPSISRDSFLRSLTPSELLLIKEAFESTDTWNYFLTKKEMAHLPDYYTPNVPNTGDKLKQWGLSDKKLKEIADEVDKDAE